MLIQHRLTAGDVLRFVVDQIEDSGLPIIANIRSIERDVGIVADVEMVNQIGNLVVDLAQVVRADVETTQARVLCDTRRPFLQTTLALVVALSAYGEDRQARTVERSPREFAERIVGDVQTIEVRQVIGREVRGSDVSLL